MLEYLRPTYGESVQAGTVTTQNTPGKVASVYTAPAGGPYLAAEDAIIYRFRILESAAPGLATVFASAFELSTPEPAAIPEDVDVSLSFQVLERPAATPGCCPLPRTTASFSQPSTRMSLPTP